MEKVLSIRLICTSITLMFMSKTLVDINETMFITHKLTEIQSYNQNTTMCSSVLNLMKDHYDWDDYDQEMRDWLADILTKNNCYVLLFQRK